MEIGQKVQIVGRFDMTQKKDAVKLSGEVIKITPKRIKVRESSAYSVFEFDRKTLKQYGGHWVVKPEPKPEKKLSPIEKLLLLKLFLSDSYSSWDKNELQILDGMVAKNLLSNPRYNIFYCTKQGEKKASKIIKDFQKSR